MNADRLLAHYERIADVPDAVPRLRRFILDLAVRGKLVEQDLNDEPAAELLKQIAAETARLVRAGKIKKQSALRPVGPYETPFTVPSAWEWTRIGSTAHVEMGQSPPSEHYNRTGQGTPFFQGKADFGKRYPTARYWCTQPKKYAAHGDILISVRAPVGPTNVASESCCIGRGLAALRSHNGIDTYYLLRCLEAFEHELAALGFGTTFVAINKNQLTGFAIPLPPLAEQHRIVAKVDELMALCDRLEKARANREATRDRLSASSLARLNVPDPDPMVFRNHAAFALEHFTPLTTRRDQIKALRQAILNLAVRGKLVAQDPNDEPAAELLKRIAKEKARLVKVRGIGREKPLPPISDGQTELEIPNGWSWCRLGNLSKFVTSGSRGWAKYYSQEGAIFVRMGNLSKAHYRLRLDQIQRVKLPSDQEGTRTRLETGDLLISITGDVGMLGLITENFGEAYINQHTAMVRPVDEMKGRYLAELFRSPFAQNQFDAPQRGIKNSFRLTDVTQFVVPLPPIDEQHRIVAKLDELMALCDRLETSLTTGDDTRFRLLGALLTEALEPGESHAPAQAERVVAHG